MRPSVYGVGSDRLRTIPRGVDLDLFDPQHVGGQRIASLARQWRLPDGVPTVMLPGRLTRWKGGLDLIAAMARLGRRDLCCVLVGAEQRPGFRRELEAAIEGGGLAGSFRIVEHCADMPAAYMLADVVVSASTDPEGFGRIIVEAQAMGRPVVADRPWRRPRNHRAGRDRLAGAGARSCRSRRSDRHRALARARRAVAARGARYRPYRRQLHARGDVRAHHRGL